MDSTLLTGPRHRDLETRAFNIAERTAGDAPGSILYIPRNDARRSSVEDTWAETHQPLRLRTETLDAVVHEWYEQLEGPATRLAGQANRRLTEYALDAGTADEANALTDESASAALADAFSTRFSLFDEAGLTTAAELASEFDDSPLDDRIATATTDVYRHYKTLQREHIADWTHTRGELIRTVAETEQSLTTLAPEVDVVILSGYYEFRPVERALLEQITEAFDTIALLPLHQSGKGGVDAVTTETLKTYEALGFEREQVETPETPLTDVTMGLYRPDPDPVDDLEHLLWRELPTPEREVRFVARELRSELANGRDPDDVAVVIPGTEAYAGSVEDTFETFDIPYTSTAASRLDRTYTGKIVHNLLALAEPDPRADDLASLLANPLTDLLSSEQTSAVTAATRRRDTVALEAMLGELESDIERPIRDLLDTLESLRTSDLETAIETLRQLLDDRLGIDDAIDEYANETDRVLERRGYALIDEVLQSFDSLQDASSDLSPLALLTRAFDGIPVRLPQTAAGSCVEVIGMLDARMRAFEKVFVVGMTAEHFPSTPERPAFFEEMTDAHPRLDTADERLRGRYLFATLLANVDEVTLTTPNTGADDSAVVRSPVLDELQRVTGVEPTTGVDERIGAREDLQRHVADCDDRRAAIDHAGKRGDFSHEQTTRVDRGVACAENRRQTGLTPHDGVLEPDTVADVYPAADREPYSASRLERYVECGFKFFAENILEIEDPDDIAVTPDPLETGSYVHDVFERFYADLQQDSSSGVDLSAYDPEELEQHLLAVALDELDAAELDYDGLFYERWLTELFAGLADKASNPYAESHRPHEAPEKGLFAAFLEQERSRGGDDRPTWFEKPFGDGLPDSETGPFEVQRPDGSTVSIRGYIDRIDVARGEDGTRLTLYDYKTGRAPYMTTTTGGTKFQLPIYLLAADGVLEEALDEADLAATYYQARPPNDVRIRRGVESKFDSQAELRQFLQDVVPRRLGAIDDAIANGRFHTTLLSEREANCTYCEYQRSCDVRHHRKRDRRDEASTDDAAYVPLRVQDDTDLEEVMSND
ncbi:PD-(D/E)XK nuclease family protein [Natronorubrum thiooxidans]|uniref:ATP-dependent helicase/nuclease subunit B n=1 Tax=Natronorubrum thiooxidans TaxID=308853 RepID=A0A1N7GVK4_9EURY|nr:PD-(D/E)XK nuclease family protein [Natronorubrum thiooxidans]SIS16586.1 ATP-dependent helicase/nuclease subunit B [Natronorubrum thiooxidans]